MAYLKIAAVAFAFSSLLSACGGGSLSPEDNQQITSVEVKSAAYSKQAVLWVGGINLRDTLKVDTGICKNPVFNQAQSSPDRAVINCTVTTTGEQALNIVGTNGQLLYSGKLTVPQPQVVMVTSQGSVTLELDPAAAPVSVTNFLAYVNNEYYRNTLFHRIIAGFVAQGGGYTTGLVKKPGQLAPIVLESNKGLLNSRSTLAMARTNAPNSATSEFYINLVDNPSLDYQSAASPGYAVFGRVIKGMDIVDKIAAVQTTRLNGFENVPTTDVIIELTVQTQ